MKLFYSSYLIGFLLCWGLSMGGSTLWMLSNLVGGEWRKPFLPLMRAMTRTFPFTFLLFLPLLFAPKDFYALPGNWYLNHPFFVTRAVLYFAVWSFFGLKLPSLPESSPSFPKWNAAGLLLFGLTLNFAAIDWILPLDAYFYSTIFGVIVFGGTWVEAFAFLILLAHKRSTPALRADWGNLLLMAILFWVYFAFSQYLIIWMGQLPREIAYYNARLRGGWQWIALLLLGSAFVLPFALLLFRSIKSSPRGILAVSGLLLFSHWVDLAWLVLPAQSPGALSLSVLPVLVPSVLAAAWLFFFNRRLKQVSYVRN